MNNTSAAVDLRAFLEGLEGHAGPERIPEALFMLARRAVGPAQTEDVAREAVATWLLKLTVATRASTPGSVRALLELDDKRLVAVVKHRLGQAALQTYPRWPTLKALRRHVSNILEDGVEPGGAMPTRVVDASGRISRKLVTRAIAALLAEGAEKSTVSISSELMTLYFEGHEGPHHTEPTSVEDLVAEHHDAHEHAHRVERILGRDTAQLVARQCMGATLETLASERGTAVSTTHSHLQGPRRRLRQLCRRSGVTEKMHVRAMALLAQGVRR